MNDNKTPDNGANKVVGLNGQPIKVPEGTPPRMFEITTIDDIIYLEEGFVCVTPHFVAVANGDGDINLVVPLTSLKLLQVLPGETVMTELLTDSENPDLFQDIEDYSDEDEEG